jgi:hypothetical protein
LTAGLRNPEGARLYALVESMKDASPANRPVSMAEVASRLAESMPTPFNRAGNLIARRSGLGVSDSNAGLRPAAPSRASFNMTRAIRGRAIYALTARIVYSRTICGEERRLDDPHCASRVDGEDVLLTPFEPLKWHTAPTERA